MNTQIKGRTTKRGWGARGPIVATGLGVAALVALVTLADIATAEAHRFAPRFTLASLHGGYTFVGRATVMPNALGPGVPPAATPGVGRGLITFNGRGGCTFAEKFNVGGGPGGLVATSCKYSVKVDGTAELSAVFPGDPNVNRYSLVIAARGHRFNMIKHGPVVASFEARKQLLRKYRARNLRGSYSILCVGTVLPPAATAAVPGVAAGLVRFDGHGKCSFKDKANVGGTDAAFTSTKCSYTVNADGTGTIDVVFAGDPTVVQYLVGLSDIGRNFYAIRLGPLVAWYEATHQ